jgi:hypothetical protein
MSCHLVVRQFEGLMALLYMILIPQVWCMADLCYESISDFLSGIRCLVPSHGISIKHNLTTGAHYAQILEELLV